MKNRHWRQLLAAFCLLILAYFIFRSEFTFIRPPVRVSISSAVTKHSALTQPGIGDPASLGSRCLTVHSVEYLPCSIKKLPQEGREYVIIYVTMENEGDVPLVYNSWNFEMSTSQGEVEQICFISEAADLWLGYGEIAPGESVSGTLSFEVPAEDPQLKLHFHFNLFPRQEIVVYL